MIRFIVIFSLILVFFSSSPAKSQSALKKEYLHGWEMYQIGRNELAMEILKPLTLPENKNPLTPYAGYYYSLAAFKLGYNYLAEEMLKYILQEYPDWEKSDYARFWLVNIYLTEEEYENGINLAIQISDNLLKDKSGELLKKELFNLESLDQLKGYYELNSESKPLGEVLADRIMMQPILDQDRILINEIVEKFDLNRSKYNIVTEIESTKKDVYNIAVLFPFMLSDIIPNQAKRSNQFILDIYEGMKMAQQDLSYQGIRLNLFAFDTKMDSIVTGNLVNSGQLNGFDLIVGPLYPEPVKVISEYSYENRINMFNPLSTNSDLIKNNPFCFLMKPSSERQAIEAGKYVIKHVKNNHGLIFYENTDRDSVMAYTFMNHIERDSSDIVLIKKISSPDSVNVYNFLTHKINFSNIALTSEDSIRIIKRYHLTENLNAFNGKNTNSRNLEVLMIAPDSIGYIFIASNNELIGANTISGVETRGDSILIIGNEDWMKFKSLSLEQMEALDIILIAPGYIDKNNTVIAGINEKIKNLLNQPPNKYHYTGYELLRYVGKMLDQYGVYFQTGFNKTGNYPGLLFQGFDYTGGNDNAVVPIIKFVNSEFKIVN